jgi:hypothetical protein
MDNGQRHARTQNTEKLGIPQNSRNAHRLRRARTPFLSFSSGRRPLEPLKPFKQNKTMKTNRPGFSPSLIVAGLLALGVAGCAPQTSADTEHHKQENLAFLVENMKKPDVVTTASGLQYQVLSEGSGAKPTATDTVTVNYRGNLISGQTFDNGQGISFPLNGVIPGWTEGLQLMKEGAKYKFFIPPQLAYGENGIGQVIPPNSTLIFEVELVKVGR